VNLAKTLNAYNIKRGDVGPAEGVSDVGLPIWKREYIPEGSFWVEEERRSE